MIRLTRSLLVAGALASVALASPAQTTTGQTTALSRQLSRFDLGVSGLGQFNHSVSGVVPNNGSANSGKTVTEKGSNTLGALVDLRYIAKPYLGVEFNYTYARYTESFNVQPVQIQTGADEMSFGYVATPPHPVFGLQPFVSVGAGSTRFKPTKGGGQGAPTQWRATYYYSVGLQKEFADSHFGIRGSFRQAFFLAPDFLQNYLTIVKRTNTIEPNIGVYLRF